MQHLGHRVGALIELAGDLFDRLPIAVADVQQVAVVGRDLFDALGQGILSGVEGFVLREDVGHALEQRIIEDQLVACDLLAVGKDLVPCDLEGPL